MSQESSHQEVGCRLEPQGERTVARHHDETTFRQLEETCAGLIEASLTGIYIDQDDRIVFANRRFAQIFGYDKEDLIGMASRKLVHPDDRALTDERRRKRLRGESVPSEYEARGVRRDGGIIWIKRRNCRIHFQGRPAVLGNLVDVTQRKRMERALKQSAENLRFLSSRLLTAQERERKRISIELHDELGQAMTVLKLRLRAVERRLPDAQAGLKNDCEKILHYVDGIIENVRRLSRDLSPAILEDLGLSAALQCLLEEIGQHYQIGMDLHMDPIDDLFTHDAQITLYRIFQEIVTNVGKHAQATQVAVRIQRESNGVSFHVGDNGCGFDLTHVCHREPTEKGLGLAALDERVRMLKGSLEIRTQPGAGTGIAFRIPLEEE